LVMAQSGSVDSSARSSSVSLIASLIATEESSHGSTEESARKVFELYCVDEKDVLQAPDVRKLLFDILEAFGWPLVVPDESLDVVFEEISINDKSSITWVEFKSFFVFLQDKPLHTLLQLVTKGISKEELSVSRLVTIDPIEAIENPSFERPLFQHAVEKMLGDKTTSVYIYFLGAGSVLALGLGKFDVVQSEIRNEQIQIGDYTYNVKINDFDARRDVFPPIQRSAGFSSKVARKIADTYVVGKQWDERHLKIGQRTADLAKLAKEKWQEFDDKYKVQQKVDSASKTTVDAVRAFDEKHQISRRLSETAKSLDEKYEISSKVQTQVDKIKSNEQVQKVSTKVSEIVKTGLDTFDQISKETQQLVNEQETHSKTEEKEQELTGVQTNQTNAVSTNEIISSEANEGVDNAKEKTPDLSTESQV
jgi:hypothetical protein